MRVPVDADANVDADVRPGRGTKGGERWGGGEEGEEKEEEEEEEEEGAAHAREGG